MRTPSPSDTASSPAPRFPLATPATLVLGSGGARGLAHIGVIQALSSDGRYDIRAVTGASIGALVGGLYAAGKLDDYTHWVRELKGSDVWSLLDFSFTRRGLFTGERLMTRLKDMLGDAQIEDLPIPFTAVACDLYRRQEVWLDRGSLFEAIRASIAIPGLFTPVERDGRVLVDGGLLSPVPVVPALQHGAPCTIAVSLNGASEPPGATRPGQGRAAAAAPGAHPQSEPARANAMQEFLSWAGRTMGWTPPTGAASDKAADEATGAVAQRAPDDGFDLISLSVDAMQDRIARHQLAACRPDLLIEIAVDACGMLEFHRAGEMIDLGRLRARRALQALDRGQSEGEAPEETRVEAADINDSNGIGSTRK